jgi:hypothetical protein
MTKDNDLVKKLRAAAKHPLMDNNCIAAVFDVSEAADRIEALEAKLAKAVEAAYREGFLAGTEDGWVNNPRIDVGWKYSRARANLAELKGDKP